MRSLLSLLSPGGDRGRLSTLIFHRVLDRPDPMQPGEVDAAQFDAVCRWVGELFNVLPLDEAAERLREGTLPPRALAITFDDGYEDNQRVASPILQRHALPATFFVATGFLDGGCMWNDIVVEAVRTAPGLKLDLTGLDWIGNAEVAAALPIGTIGERRATAMSVLRAIKHLPPAVRLRAAQLLADRAESTPRRDLMMTSQQVRALRAAGMQIGAHTVSHPILAVLEPDAIREEIAASKAALEGILGERISLFAYPNGKPRDDYSAEAVRAVRSMGFDAAVSTAWGAARVDSDQHQLPRFTPWDRDATRFALRLARSLWTSRVAFDQVAI